MNAIVTTGIVLSRTDYQEADRILTILTPDQGKIRVIAKGVRKVKSKLAGGIELFSVSHISFIPGKKDLGTLISTRLETHFGKIALNLDRTMLAYDVLKLFNRLTEDNPEPEYFQLLAAVLDELNSSTDSDLIHCWLYLRLLELSGHRPNLLTDTNGQKLTADQRYSFDFEAMTFSPQPKGAYTADIIKFLRLALAVSAAHDLAKIQGREAVLPASLLLTRTMLSQYVNLN